MKNQNRRVKIFGLILGILLFIGLVAGLTYAYYESSTSTGISGSAGCFYSSVNGSTNNNNVTGELLLFDESEIISNNTITVKNGMAVTNVIAGINSGCNEDAYLSINLTANTLNDAFISGNSVGALKYVIAEYSNNLSTITSSALNNQSFTIVKQGSVTTTTKRNIYEVDLPKGSQDKYLIIFYIDGDLAMNDAGNGNAGTTFRASIEAIATQGKAKIPLSGVPAVNYITNLFIPDVVDGEVDTTNQMRKVVHSNLNIDDDYIDYRYYGTIANVAPNNYVFFNCDDYGNQNADTCEIWRILGVVDGNVKLMKGSKLENMAFDENGRNGWESSSLKEYLNGDTLGHYYYTLSSVTKDMIAEKTYYLRGSSSIGVTASEALIMERKSGSVPSGNSTWTGKIAIPYASDYGYASDIGTGSDQCSTKLNIYNNNNCKNSNWINMQLSNSPNNIWLITPKSSSTSNVCYADSSGHISTYNNVTYTYAVFPVVYLLPSVLIVTGDGNGSIDNPYHLITDSFL